MAFPRRCQRQGLRGEWRVESIGFQKIRIFFVQGESFLEFHLLVFVFQLHVGVFFLNGFYHGKSQLQ